MEEILLLTQNMIWLAQWSTNAGYNAIFSPKIFTLAASSIVSLAILGPKDEMGRALNHVTEFTDDAAKRRALLIGSGADASRSQRWLKFWASPRPGGYDDQVVMMMMMVWMKTR